MQQYHELKTSLTQRILLLGAYLLAVGVIYFCLSPSLLKWAGLAGLGVSALIEYRRLIQQGIIRLRVNPQRSTIEIQQAGQPYFYTKYKVYQTRWFAILKLVDTQNNRTLILNSDCFESTDCYRRCRYDLRRLEGSDAA
jgi:hypothetical protein